MSLVAIKWAWQQQVPAGAKFVLLALADYANEDGVCFPSQKTLAKKCNLSRATINVHLLSAQLIFIQHQSNAEGRRNSSLYRLHLDQNLNSRQGMSEIQTRVCPDSRQHITSKYRTNQYNRLCPESGHERKVIKKPALEGLM